jgi:hypothetical protein
MNQLLNSITAILSVLSMQILNAIQNIHTVTQGKKNIAMKQKMQSQQKLTTTGDLTKPQLVETCREDKKPGSSSSSNKVMPGISLSPFFRV